MLEFNTVDEVFNADIDSNIKAYISSHIAFITKIYGVNSLKKVGSLFFVCESDESDLKLGEIYWEYTEIINIHNPANQSVSSVLHGTAVKNNDCAIDVYMSLSAPDSTIKREMLINAEDIIHVSL